MFASSHNAMDDLWELVSHHHAPSSSSSSKAMSVLSLSDWEDWEVVPPVGREDMEEALTKWAEGSTDEISASEDEQESEVGLEYCSESCCCSGCMDEREEQTYLPELDECGQDEDERLEYFTQRLAKQFNTPKLKVLGWGGVNRRIKVGPLKVLGG